MMKNYRVWDRFQVDHNDIISKTPIYWDHTDKKIEYKNIFPDQKTYET